MLQTTAKQKEAIRLLTDNTVDIVGYGGAAGGGKSYIGCYWLMQMCYYAPFTRYFIGRDSLKDTRQSVLKTWSKIASDIKFTQYKFDDIGIVFKNGSEIELLDLSYYPYKDPLFERFGSKEYTGGWIEEASQTHEMALTVLRTRVGRWKNDEYNIKSKILCTFNPKKNWVDSLFYRPFKSGKEADNIKFIYALASDNPHLPKDYLKSLYDLPDGATKQRLLFGNFDYDDDPNALLTPEQINAVFTNNHLKGNGKMYIVADIARFGSDKAIISVWNDYIIVEYQVFDKSKTTELAACIHALRAKYKIPAYNCVADEDGVGGGVVDQTGVKGFVNNHKSPLPAYQNLKTLCAYELAKNIEKIYFEAETSEQVRKEIKQELGQLKAFEADKDNKLRILPKEQIKANIGRSPDWLDVLIMRMYFNVKPKEMIVL